MATDGQTITAWLTTSGIKNRFDEEGIQTPYPHRILFWGEPQEKEH